MPRVSLPILWWLQARTRAAVLEKRLKNMPREDPSEAAALRARVAALEEAVRNAELHAARQTARATEAEAKAARLIEAPPAYDTAEGERILKERLDELRRGTLDPRARRSEERAPVAENAAATQELQECRRKLAMDHVEAESKLAAELDRLTAETVDAKRQLNDCRRKLAIEKEEPKTLLGASGRLLPSRCEPRKLL